MPTSESLRGHERGYFGPADRSHVVMRKVAPGTVSTVARFAWEDSLFRDARITGTVLLVAVALARHANRDLRKPVFPATATTAREIGTSRQTVSRATAILERFGYLTEADRLAYRQIYPELSLGDQRVKAWLLTLPAS